MAGDDQRGRRQFGKIALAVIELRSATRRAADGKRLARVLLVEVTPSIRPPA